MSSVTIGDEAMRECARCGGLWVDVASFEKICADREQQSAVLGTASPVPGHQISAGSEPIRVSYAPCPQCCQLMNRINFARCSGVVVDVCKGHGTWFDRDELRGIVEFIRGGGLDISRQKEKTEIESQRQKLRMEQMAVNSAHLVELTHTEEDRISGLAAARELLKFLVK